jgi:hypothetical protein
VVVAIQAVVRVAAAVSFLQLLHLPLDRSHLRLAGGDAAIEKARVLVLDVDWVSWVRTRDHAAWCKRLARSQGHAAARK